MKLSQLDKRLITNLRDHGLAQARQVRKTMRSDADKQLGLQHLAVATMFNDELLFREHCDRFGYDDALQKHPMHAARRHTVDLDV